MDAVSSASKAGGAKYTGVIDFEGEEKILLASPIETSYWTTGLVFSTNELNETLNKLIVELLILGAIITFVASIIASLFGSKITKYIKRLQN